MVRFYVSRLLDDEGPYMLPYCPVSRVPFLPILLLAALSLHAAEFQFDAAGITATGVTPQATTYWASASVGSSGGVPVIGRDDEILTDANGDGVVRWDVRGMLPRGLWMMIDGGDRSVTVRNHEGLAVAPKPFPARSFLRDQNGHYPRVVFKTADLPFRDGVTAVWVRPGVGMWGAAISRDGGARDENGISDGTIVLDVLRFDPFEDSPAPPPGIDPGDFFIFLGTYGEYWTGGLVDEHLPEADGAGKLEFGSYSGSEDARKIVVKVFRLDGSDGAASAHYETSDGTATAGLNYEATSGTVFFDAGQLVSTFEVPVIDDQVIASPYFVVTLSNPSGAALGSRSTMSAVIADNDDQPQVTIERKTVPEGDGGPTEVPVRFTLNHTAPKPVTLEWRARNRYDGSTLETGVLEFAVGEKEKSITIHYVADDLWGSRRLIDLDITSAINCTPGLKTLLTIEDDDQPEHTLFGDDVSESAGFALVTIQLKTPVSWDYVVSWQTIEGSAKAVEDFTPSSGNMAINAGNSFAILIIPIRQDGVREGTESFDVAVTFASGEEPVIATVTIYNDDQLSAPSSLDARGDGSSVTLTWSAVAGATSYQIHRNAGSGFLLHAYASSPSYVDLAVSPGKAYLYRVYARGQDGVSGASPTDVATTIAFTDPVLVGTPIKTVHLTELRAAINALRATVGLGPAVFTDSTLSAGMLLRAVHLTELRAALTQARATAGLSAVISSETITAGVTARASHLTELRDGVQ